VSPIKDSSVINTPSESVKECENTGAGSVVVKKPFIEPAISLPVDVLEATAFFMQATAVSGGTLLS
jgi:hypothetical protein